MGEIIFFYDKTQLLYRLECKLRNFSKYKN